VIMDAADFARCTTTMSVVGVLLAGCSGRGSRDSTETHATRASGPDIVEQLSAYTVQLNDGRCLDSGKLEPPWSLSHATDSRTAIALLIGAAPSAFGVAPSAAFGDRIEAALGSQTLQDWPLAAPTRVSEMIEEGVLRSSTPPNSSFESAGLELYQWTGGDPDRFFASSPDRTTQCTSATGDTGVEYFNCAEVDKERAVGAWFNVPAEGLAELPAVVTSMRKQIASAITDCPEVEKSSTR
jgi:hypothetical protein